MIGHLKGFVAHVKELNEDILVTHCFLHREALVTKFLPSDLKIVLEQCVKMVNYIKSRPLESRFSKLCQAMEAKYEFLLLHTEVLDESRSFFRVHTSYFSNIPKCIKAEFIASWACSQSSVVSSSKR
ncbi:uncharacterized protein TNCV_3417741 [Trichonephila clavipes]|nr:uncharacterized protein TNCV_3417741 [Trichonephila clavipes]